MTAKPQYCLKLTKLLLVPCKNETAICNWLTQPRALMLKDNDM